MSTTVNGVSIKGEVVDTTENLLYVRGDGKTIRTVAVSCPLCGEEPDGWGCKTLPAHVRKHCVEAEKWRQ